MDVDRDSSERRQGRAGRRWLVSGRVQGVGFRFHVLLEARRLKLCGDVRNLADGRVEVRAQGPPAALDALLGALQRGPRGARVDVVETHPLEDGLTFEDFGVRY